MNSKTLLRSALASVFLALSGAQLSADVVETKNGSRLVGTVTAIGGGNVTLSTDYAGALTIKQSDVVSITTDNAVAVRLASGTRIDGKIATSAGTLQITGADGVVTTSVAKVAASWKAGATDPEVAALDRKWAYEANVDVTGKSGNKSQLGTAFGFRAKLAGVNDTLQFYTAYDRQVTDGQKSADQFKLGTDYANNFSGAKSWYVRDEGGFDRIKDVELYNVAAFGLGYDIIKAAKQTLTTRAGLSFRYEGYKSPLTADVKSAGMDFGLAHSLQLETFSIVNRLAIVPAFDDFSNFRLTHESFLELPLANPNWKLRMGVANDYNSKPGKGVDKMDTGYFTRLVLNWR
jgi:putative salt-induced outer membrane protein YdiY